ncbi:hypothetical protein LC608_33040 [Nostoc sp. XA010]|uniref:hypothetical protein n=1 Tax=Nostoc sp. XA010 TaxID=2780407 RepID=UPI001E329AA7|nr:hypothetical protein [Nostoc sp. XA010]MCC5661687.1 hypothetical protein [Nostoc sp. XA010]
MWAIGVMGWGVGGKSGAEIQFGSLLEKPLLRENLKQDLVLKNLVKKLGCNSSAERYKLQDYTTGVGTCT